MKPRPVKIFWIWILVLLPALACNLPMTGTPTPTMGVLTQVALTVDAELALTGTVTPAVSATSTQVLASPTQPPAATQAQSTRVPATATSQPCNEASFIQDVTIPDGTKMAPGQAFTKTWRLRNIGTCTWTAEYAVIFISGDALGAPAVVNLKGDVPPNDTVDFSIEMKAPQNPGKYTGFWKMRSPEGVSFGVSGLDQPFYVQIEVTAAVTQAPTTGPTPTRTVTPTKAATSSAATATQSSSGVIYNLADNYCEAEWRSQQGALECPGIQNDAWGYASQMEDPRLEDGTVESAPVLLTVPDSSANGAITGKYPAQGIQAGYRFQAELGCAEGATSCSVVYQLNYIIGSSKAANLGQWTHSYNGQMTAVDVDLTPLAGKQVQMILAVLANGSSEDDQAVWVNPRIVKP